MGGAVAGYVRDAKGNKAWRIVKGASADYLRKVRTQKGQKQRPKPLKPRAAKIAFNRYYKNSPRFKNARGRQQAKTYDLNHSVRADRVVADARYRRSPHLYDYPGLDDGDHVRAPRSKKQNDHSENMRNKEWRATHNMKGGSGRKGRKRGSVNKSKHCGIAEGHNRCAKRHHPKNSDLCYLSRKATKSGRRTCRKKTGSRNADVQRRLAGFKSPEAVARGRALRQRMMDEGRL